jgi:hypothetical protein
VFLRVTGLFLLICSLQPLLAAAPHVLVLEDFETANAAQKWDGSVQVVTGRASHGNKSLRIAFQPGRTEIGTTKLPHDWRGYDRLLFDAYSDRDGPILASLRIYDARGGDVNRAATDDYYNAENKLFLLKGWNHIEVKLTPLRASSYLRDIALDRIVRVLLEVNGSRLPVTLLIDNLRLVQGQESNETTSRTQPGEVVNVIDNRWVTVRQVARPEDVPESPQVTALRQNAQQEFDLLERAIQAAKLQGIETIYEERSLVVGQLGLRIRPLLAWYNNDRNKKELFAYVSQSCRNSRLKLEDELTGGVRVAEGDDTQVTGPLIRPLPPLKGRPIEGRFFMDDHHEPMMILSLHSPSQALQRFFATPRQHIESYTVGGGSRWTIDTSPVYKAFKEDPDTHRVGWDGWCGHLIRDLSSMGGTKKENVVICLESPRIQKAVQSYIRCNIPKFHANPDLLYDIMGYELMYICYCDRSQHMFRKWLEEKHGTIEEANEKWGTSYKSFDEVVAPPVKNSRPLPGTNRALWYDWARFNQDRFTNYLIKVRNIVRSVDPSVPLAAGGSSSMLAGRTGTTGIDEERIVNEVDDLIIHEGGGSTLGPDLQLALSENKKPLVDPEMSLGSVEDLFPQFLHGKSVAQLYHWPVQPANEFHSNNLSSFAHSWRYSLHDVDELLRTALDIRRLNKEIAAFSDPPAETAILYSQTSTLQIPPKMLTWQTTPYLAELKKSYEASQYLDAKVTFITERQIRKGWLDRYKLIIIPAVRNIPSDVVKQIWTYASRGGAVVITPESFLGDEYNHPEDYLKRLGVKIGETQRPAPGGIGSLVQGYDQSFSQQVTFSSGRSVTLRPDSSEAAATGALDTQGVQQRLEIDRTAKVLYSYPDGTPAVVRFAIGKGSVYYAAASLTAQSYSRLLDSLFDNAGIQRPIRTQNLDGSAPWKIEARFAPLGKRKLLYVVNFNDQPMDLKLQPKSGPIEMLHQLRDDITISGDHIKVEPHQTYIYELEQRVNQSN